MYNKKRKKIMTRTAYRDCLKPSGVTLNFVRTLFGAPLSSTFR